MKKNENFVLLETMRIREISLHFHFCVSALIVDEPQEISNIFSSGQIPLLRDLQQITHLALACKHPGEVSFISAILYTLNSLPANQRELLWTTYFITRDGDSQRDIEHYGPDKGYSKSGYYRARKKATNNFLKILGDNFLSEDPRQKF